MQIRDYFSALFGRFRTLVKTGTWREIGTFTAQFSSFGSDIYTNDIVRGCIRSLAEHTSKANPRVVRRTSTGWQQGDQRLQQLIQMRPNPHMSGKDFLYKVRTTLEIHNTAFIFIERENVKGGGAGRVIGLHPVPPAQHEAVEIQGERLAIQFSFPSGRKQIIPWGDLAVLRKDYLTSEIYGESNAPIRKSLELLNTTNEGLANAIKSTANLRGILKSTKAMLDPASVKKQKEDFVRDYLNIENEGGIASLDATQDFQPITMAPQIANYKQTEELRLNIYRYFGVNDDILMSKVVGDNFAAFYESRIEPFLLALSLELTYKIFSDRERGFGNEIVFEANRMQFASADVKLRLMDAVDRGIMTLNEYREILNMAPVEGGDVRIIRKEYAQADKLNEIQGVSDDAIQDGTGIQSDAAADSGGAGEADSE